jgi:HAD superfamily hydrolase (TIGR01549 family)|tara:strand:+ start:1973 stop:2578 length:606 start_codon:yes stop_codon:yes gene_type:complete
MDKTFIFDLDGTLITLPIDYDELREEMKKFFNVDYDFFRIIQTAVSLSEDNKNTLEEAFGIICEKENDAIKGIKINDHAKDVLELVKSKGYNMALVTLQCRKAAEKILDIMEVKDLFSHIITRDESHDRYEQIMKTINFMNISEENTTMIGDRLNDVECSLRAGCKSVLIGKKYEIKNERVVCFNKLDELLKADIEKLHNK